MRVALLTDGIWPQLIGGMQKHSYYLCKYLAVNDVKVDLYYTTKRKKTEKQIADIFSADELRNITPYLVDYPAAKKYPGHYLKESYEYSKSVFNKLKEQLPKYDLVYIQGFSGWYYLEQQNERPVSILNFHGLEMFQQAASLKNSFEQAMFKPFVKKILKKADYVQSLGGKLTDILIANGVAKQKILTIGIAIEKEWLSQDIQASNSKRCFTFIGRYERRKGIEELSIVLNKLKDQKDFLFNFIGPIPDDKKIVSDKIRYYGEVKDEVRIKCILDETDFLVVPSHSEGMPTVILEAMARGCSIIATDVGAVAEQVGKENGFLIAPGNGSALYHSLLQAIDMDANNLQQQKTASLSKIQQRFIWNVLLPEMKQAFNTITTINQNFQ